MRNNYCVVGSPDLRTSYVLGMPIWCSVAVVVCSLVCIIVGSFYDYQISVFLAKQTELGSLFARFGNYVSFCLYPAAGYCIFKGMQKSYSPKNTLAQGIFVLSYAIAVYFANSIFGKSLFGYTPGKSTPFLYVLSYLTCVLSFIWIPFFMEIILDERKHILLITVGCIILVAGLTSHLCNDWLKQVGSRPRFKYLLTLENPIQEFRNWWEMLPYFAGSNDSFKSWPSGHMTYATMVFALPMFADVVKSNHKEQIRYILFALACVWVIVYGYNRIHMTNHFLSDVGFGVLITYVIHVICFKYVNAEANHR